jgi:hypothetical protein
MLITPTFIAYADQPPDIGDTIEAAAKLVQQPPGEQTLLTWRGLAIGGQFIASRVHEGIDNHGCLIGDLSVLNENVTYEIGYAIGREKRLILIMNTDFPAGKDEIDKIGIFDTIGWLRYANSEQLVVKIRRTSPRRSEVFSGFPAHSQGSICRIRSTSALHLTSEFRRSTPNSGLRD